MFSTNRSRGLAALAAALCACADGAEGGQDAGGTIDASDDDADQSGDAGSGEDTEPCRPDTSAPVPEDRCGSEGCGSWFKQEPAGAQCSDGSQYKFFVNLSPGSNNLLIMFEGGGACWDYASCSGGARGAANRNGISDMHMERTQFMNLLRRDEQNPLKDWNMVFVPYCTGDVHTGRKVATYEPSDGSAPLTYRHVGHDNTLAVIDWIKQKFGDVPQLLVTGYSAGGIGALQNYLLIREALTGVQCGYLLNDSGPAFHSDGPSKHVQAITREAWGVEELLDELEGQLPIALGDIKEDAALLNTALADKYPHDRLSMTVFEMDLNYSLYSYERFFPGISEAEVHEKWSEELDWLLQTFETRSNLGYYVPYFRSDNCSHCVTIPPLSHDVATILATPWLGTDIAEAGLNLRDYIEQLLDPDQPLRNYREAPQPSEAFTAEEAMKCMTP